MAEESDAYSWQLTEERVKSRSMPCVQEPVWSPDGLCDQAVSTATSTEILSGRSVLCFSLKEFDFILHEIIVR